MAGALMAMMGGSGQQVDFIDRNAYFSAVTPANAASSWETTSAGLDVSSGDTPGSRTWLLLGASSDYQLFVHLESGPGAGATITAGVFDTWQTMNATLTYTVTRTSDVAAASAAAMTCQVRRVSDSVVIDTFSVNITAEVLP